MEVTILKDWAGYKKGSKVDVTDKDALEKGFEIGLFEKAKEKPKKED